MQDGAILMRELGPRIQSGGTKRCQSGERSVGTDRATGNDDAGCVSGSDVVGYANETNVAGCVTGGGDAGSENETCAAVRETGNENGNAAAPGVAWTKQMDSESALGSERGIHKAANSAPGALNEIDSVTDGNGRAYGEWYGLDGRIGDWRKTS
ncbi:hypothetical protein PF008_g17448 [Phytophthora fragariae]|uniref:Uncharacterized protein n=1 Tax=Phytophthora fragariae TaxID=53985 RepID=A0A6G0R9L8_9STRA|nr:hypothetical protein PF008_g17448 [Phytophthora fragariae]